MSLVPKSLFSRLVLVLLGGLLAAQIASLALHMHERGELMSQASGVQSAQRIADIVRLFESMSPSERRRVAQVLNAPPLAVSLDRAPMKAASGEGDLGVRAAMFESVLRRYLVEERDVAVSVTEVPYASVRAGPGYGMKGGRDGDDWHAMRHARQPGLSFVAQVRLKDGALATFDARQPQATVNWPYRLLASVALLFAAVVAVSLVAVRWATRPLDVLADAADELGRDINRPPLAETGPVEVARAARAFNTMQSRLAGYLRERTRVLAAMSHDLKTPITRLRLRAELLDDAQQRAKFTSDLQEMESMVSSALDFLRGVEDGEAVQPVDVTALLESLRNDARETGGDVSIEGRADAAFPGRPQALKRCIGNLVDNAVKYGVRARIVVEDGAEAMVLRVLDEGPGLPPEELEKVFEPYYRVEASRNRETGGTGLGLAIARNIAQAQGGSIVLRNRPEGGLEATLRLPRVRPAAK